MDTLLVPDTLYNPVAQVQNQIITSSNPSRIEAVPIRPTRVNRSYTLAEDKLIWQAWSAKRPRTYDSLGPSHLALAQQLKRVPSALHAHMIILQQQVNEANRVVRSGGVTLVPGSSAHRIWCAYSNANVNIRKTHTSLPDGRAVKLISDKYGWNRVALFQMLEAICTVKRVLRMSGLHDTDLPHIVPRELQPQSVTFIFSLKNDSDIWRAYRQHHQHIIQRALSRSLRELAGSMGCTLTQIEARLSDLIKLHLGILKQCHSNGRPFTAKEDKVIGNVIDGEPRNAMVTISAIAGQFNCRVVAVIARRKQLMILRRLQDVDSLPQFLTSSTTNDATILMSAPTLQGKQIRLEEEDEEEDNNTIRKTNKT